MHEYESSWRHARMFDERVRALIPLFLSLLMAPLIAMLLLSSPGNGEKLAIGAFAGIVVMICTFLKPEWSLIAVTWFAPLQTGFIGQVGSLIPGTGLTPLNLISLMLIIGAWLQRSSPHPPAVEATPVDQALLRYLGWTLFGVFISIPRWWIDSRSIGEWLAMACAYMMYWVVRRRWRSQKLAQLAVLVVVGLVAYEAFVVMRQYSGQNTQHFDWDLKYRIYGTFPPGNSNDIGCYLSVYCMIALGLFLSLRRSLFRWLFLGVFVLGVQGTFMSYSRASYLALAAGLLVCTLYKHKRYMVPAILTIIVLPGLMPGSIQSRINTRGDNSAENRKDFWKNGMRIMMFNPVGLGWRGYMKHEKMRGETFADPHSMYVLVAAEQGPLGLYLFLAMLATCGREIVKAIKRAKTPFAQGLGVGLFGALISYCVNNVFGSRMLWFYSAQHFFLLLGLLMVLTKPPAGEATVEVEEPAAEPEKKALKAGSPWRYRPYV